MSTKNDKIADQVIAQVIKLVIEIPQNLHQVAHSHRTLTIAIHIAPLRITPVVHRKTIYLSDV